MSGRVLPYDQFMAYLENAPWPVIDLIAVGRKGIWLSLRKATENDSSYDRMWHLPGGFILKGESIHECVQRITQKELGATVSADRISWHGQLVNNPDEVRGHLIHIPLVLDLRAYEGVLWQTDESRFFQIATLENLPRPMIAHHETIISQYLGACPSLSDTLRTYSNNY